MKGRQSTQAIPSPKMKNCIKKACPPLDPLKYLPLNYQQNILEKPESVGSAVVSWKSKVLGLTMGRKSTYSPFQEHNQPNVAVILFCCTPIHKIMPNAQSSCSSWMGTENLHCLCDLLMDIEAVTFGPYKLKQRFIFSPDTRSTIQRPVARTALEINRKSYLFIYWRKQEEVPNLQMQSGLRTVLFSTGLSFWMLLQNLVGIPAIQVMKRGFCL